MKYAPGDFWCSKPGNCNTGLASLVATDMASTSKSVQQEARSQLDLLTELDELLSAMYANQADDNEWHRMAVAWAQISRDTHKMLTDIVAMPEDMNIRTKLALYVQLSMIFLFLDTRGSTLVLNR